ncbi:Protein shisa-5 [Willisornis vidua]|uniref:Protein shisa-5 n=1 Tax=Willisornis vidua TaxID=1566151 RepID=A0ABQ9DQT3_9PASS|nr:Protein shisa-5 [Willisornis vidua]
MGFAFVVFLIRCDKYEICASLSRKLSKIANGAHCQWFYLLMASLAADEFVLIPELNLVVRDKGALASFLLLCFGTLIAIGVTVFAVIIITIVLCLTCSCCCLYKACRKPRPVVTTTATTTVVHAPYPQQPAVPPSYPVAPYQGYQPVAIQPQPGMPVAPYPAQYPPPYPMQPSGPPAYHETVAAGAGAPYPSQPPYNPAYMDPQKPTY